MLAGSIARRPFVRATAGDPHARRIRQTFIGFTLKCRTHKLQVIGAVGQPTQGIQRRREGFNACPACRFTFNLSLLNFQLTPNRSPRNADFHWRRGASECYQRIFTQKTALLKFNPFNWHNLEFGTFNASLPAY
jgi:hypothetical protein